MAPTGPVYINGTNQPLQMGKVLGEGADGVVYELAQTKSPDVAKLFKHKINGSQADKLRLMSNLTSAPLQKVATMPLLLLKDKPTQQGSIVGFTMRRVPQYEEIHSVINPQARLSKHSTADWRFLLRLARNVSAAIHQVHQFGIVLGDINDRNIAVHPDSSVTIMDADSWQWSEGGRILRCERGVPMFTPPELHSSVFSNVDRTQNHDLFGLSILIFQLLFMGRHPYIGVYKNGTADMPYDKAIPEHRFAYGKNAGRFEMQRPPGVPPLSLVGPECSELFELAFSRDATRLGRPNATNWHQALAHAEGELTQCLASDNHYFHRSLAKCPWCEIEIANSVFFFPVKLSAELARLEKKLAELGASISLISYPSPTLASLTSMAARQPLTFGPETTFADAKKQVETLQKYRDGVQAQWDKLSNGYYDQLCSDAEHKKLLKQVDSLRGRVSATKNSIDKARSIRLAQSREIEVNDYLSRFILQPGSVPGIGPSLCATLQSYGISSAADINQGKLVGIPGIGATRMSDLAAWRTSLAQRAPPSQAKSNEASIDGHMGRVFAPQLRPINAELGRLEAALRASKTTLEARRKEAYEAFVGVGVKLEQASHSLMMHQYAFSKMAKPSRFASPSTKIWATSQPAVSPPTAKVLAPNPKEEPRSTGLFWFMAVTGIIAILLVIVFMDRIQSAISSSQPEILPIPTMTLLRTPLATAIQVTSAPIDSSTELVGSSKIATRSLKVYEFSKERTGVVCQLDEGDSVWIIDDSSMGGTSSPWIRIDDQNGCSGFVSKAYLQ